LSNYKSPATNLSREGRFLVQLFFLLAALFVIIVAASAFAYVTIGIASVGYGPPLGEVMSFILNAANVSGEAAAAIFALLALLHQGPRFGNTSILSWRGSSRRARGNSSQASERRRPEEEAFLRLS